MTGFSPEGGDALEIGHRADVVRGEQSPICGLPGSHIGSRGSEIGKMVKPILH
jgi:hypothetical protein